MSYGKLKHANQSKPKISGIAGHSNPGADSDSESQHGPSHDGREEDYELRDLSHVTASKIAREDDFDIISNDNTSEDGKDFNLRKTRRASASTVHSFMLYTPDEEKAVIKRFDRRLVLFVALLYMLSFLDRSSMSFPIIS